MRKMEHSNQMPPETISLCEADCQRLVAMREIVKERLRQWGRPVPEEIRTSLLVSTLVRLHGTDETVTDVVAWAHARLTGVPLEAAERLAVSLNDADRAHQQLERQAAALKGEDQ